MAQDAAGPGNPAVAHADAEVNAATEAWCATSGWYAARLREDHARLDALALNLPAQTEHDDT